jgi:hypothetical protein
MANSKGNCRVSGVFVVDLVNGVAGQWLVGVVGEGIEALAFNAEARRFWRLRGVYTSLLYDGEVQRQLPSERRVSSWVWLMAVSRGFAGLRVGSTVVAAARLSDLSPPRRLQADGISSCEISR